MNGMVAQDGDSKSKQEMPQAIRKGNVIFNREEMEYKSLVEICWGLGNQTFVPPWSLCLIGSNICSVHLTMESHDERLFDFSSLTVV